MRTVWINFIKFVYHFNLILICRKKIQHPIKKERKKAGKREMKACYGQRTIRDGMEIEMAYSGDEPTDIYSPSSEYREKHSDFAVANCLVTLKCIPIVISLMHIIKFILYCCWQTNFACHLAFLFLNFDFRNLTVNFRDALIYSNCLLVEIFRWCECTHYTCIMYARVICVCECIFDANLWIIHIAVFLLRSSSLEKFKFATFLCYWPLCSIHLPVAE